MPNTPWLPALQREPLGLAVEDGKARARLHRVHDDAVVVDREPGDMRGPGERIRHLGAVAEMIIQHLVAGRLVVELRRTRLDGVGDVVTAGSTSISSATASAASRAWFCVFATTTATGSPTKRTLPLARHGAAATSSASVAAEVCPERAFQRAVAHRREIGRRIDRRRRRPSPWQLLTRCPSARRARRGCAQRRHRAGPAGSHRRYSGPRRARGWDLPALDGLANAELHRGEVVGGCPNVHENTVSRRGRPHGTQNAPDGSAAGMSQGISLARYCAAARVKAANLLPC